MNDMHHLNAKLLSSIDKSNHENKMLRNQPSTFNDCSSRPKCNQTQQKRCHNMKTVKATPDVTLQHAGPNLLKKFTSNRQALQQVILNVLPVIRSVMIKRAS